MCVGFGGGDGGVSEKSKLPFPGAAHEWCLSDGAKQNAAFNACKGYHLTTL